MRTIKSVTSAFKVNMGGIILDQALPYRGVDQIDPFLLIHHWATTYKGGQQQSKIGVGPHPHRGFAPVTFIFKGGVHHRDSLGESEVVSAGGTQWMNSGKGIVHSERPSKELAEAGGDFEIIQFWINAPAKNKMDEPNYQPLSKEDTPMLPSVDGKVDTYVVAGQLHKTKGKIDPYSDVLILRLDMREGGEVTLPIPENYNAFIYQLDGELVVNADKTTGAKSLVWFNNDGKSIKLKANKDSRLIMLSGKPIAEPVATYGPFVMNDNTEIMQAINDYQEGKMGVLNEVFE